MTDRPRLAVALLVLLAAAVALMLVPVKATYINRVDSDLLEFRTASCDAPVASLLGADPGLGGGTEFPIGGETAVTACEAASGKRVVGALALLLAASLVWGLSRDRTPSSDRLSEPSAV